MEDDRSTTIPTFTHLWKIDGVLYTLGDWVLPTPVNIRSAIVFIVTLAPQAIILFKFGLFGQLGIASLAISAFLGWAADKPAFGGRTITQLVVDHWEYMMSKKNSYDLMEDSKPGSSYLEGDIFVPSNDDMVSDL